LQVMHIVLLRPSLVSKKVKMDKSEPSYLRKISGRRGALVTSARQACAPCIA
jgi:hypothetical protein